MLKLKITCKRFLQFFIYFGIVFGYNTCKITLKGLFPGKSNRCINILYIASILYSVFSLSLFTSVILATHKRNNYMNEEWSTNNTSVTLTGAITHEGSFWSVQILVFATMLISIYHSFSQDVGVILYKIR